MTTRASKEGSSGGGGGRQPWDIGRFAKTVMFFNDIPTPDKVLMAMIQQPAKIIGGLFTSNVEAQKTAVTTLLTSPGSSTAAAQQQSSEEGVILVTGATGGVGKRVVQRLLGQGRRVRALVRDVNKAKQLLGNLSVSPGGVLELAAADIVQQKTLLPDLLEGVAGVISCTAVKVVPKEGDTANRDKYYQGIKFYDPEIVGDTPETVEYVGIRNLLEAVKGHVGLEQGQVLLSPDSSALANWGALDDVVMGGVSSSSIVRMAGEGEQGGPAAVFRGIVSTNNSGGFTSVRCKNFNPLLNLGPYEGIQLRVRGDGLRYKLIIRTDTSWDGIGYSKSFDTKAGEWQTIRLPFDDFTPVFRAKVVRDAPKFNTSQVASVQLMLSKFEYDGALNPAFKAGVFELPIAEMKAYMAEPVTARFIHVSSAGVTRPNRPGINVDMEPPAVKLNDELGGILTYKLRGEDEIRRSGVPFVIVRPCALTEEPAGAPLEIDQGDVIKGKISREDVADLCVSLLSLPDTVGTTFEIKSTVPFSTPWQVDSNSPPATRDWQQTLTGLRKGVTGKTVDGRYTGKEPEPTSSGVTQRQTAGVA
eukprot:jgi/Chrzof1/13643/Cz08g05160.t1